MGALNRMRKCLIFVGNGFGQIGAADVLNVISEKIKQYVTYRPHRATTPEREVLMEI